MNLKFVSFLILLLLVSSCTQLEEIQLYNYSPIEIDVRLGENSNIVAPGESFRFSVLSYHIFSIVAGGKRLNYTPGYWDLSYVHQTRCGWWSCRLVYLRFDADNRIRIVKPENRKEAALPQTQPSGFPLEAITDQRKLSE